MAVEQSSPCADPRVLAAFSDNPSLELCTFEDFFGRLKPFVEQSAKKHHGLNKRVDIDDLKQAGYITLWKAYGSFNPDIGVPIEHYARRAVVNSILTECKRGPSEQEILYCDCAPAADGGREHSETTLIEMLYVDEVDVADPVFEHFAGQEVDAIIDGAPLTAIQRHILDLLYQQGLNTQEAATLLRVSHQNVSKQHRKAVDACRNHLGITVH